MRAIKVTKAGYIYADGVKVSKRVASPFYNAAELLSDEELEVVDEWVKKNYRMVNC